MSAMASMVVQVHRVELAVRVEPVVPGAMAAPAVRPSVLARTAVVALVVTADRQDFPVTVGLAAMALMSAAPAVTAAMAERVATEATAETRVLLASAVLAVRRVPAAS